MKSILSILNDLKNFLSLHLGLGMLTAFLFLLPVKSEAQVFTLIEDGNITARGLNSISASWVDVDNDGDLDLFVSNPTVSTGNYLYKNHLVETGNANFNRWMDGDLTKPGFGSFGNSWADYDNDGDIDCFVTGRFSSRLFRNDGVGGFTLVSTGDIGTKDNRGFACAWADYNNDGFVDLVVSLPAGFQGLPQQPNHLFLNNGDGSFTKIDSGATPVTSGLAPYTVPSWSDFDNDGDMDLFIGSGPADGTLGPDYLYKNLLKETGTQSFERITSGILATTLRDGQIFNWIDYDNDGDLDVFITNYSGNVPAGIPNELYRNDNGTFTRVLIGDLVNDNSISLGSVWEDFDNDGDLDVYVTTDIGQDNFYYSNNGDGTFTRIDTSIVTQTELAKSWGASAGDYDNDGDIDLFVPNLKLPSSSKLPKNLLFRNDSNNHNNWLTLNCIGTVSNKTAVGTKVRAKAIIFGQPVWQLREISTQNSFNGMNSLRAHFGLGDATIVDSLVFEWPLGIVDVLTNVNVNQILTVAESSNLPKIQNTSSPNQFPGEFVLMQNYPNPFNPSTSMQYSIGSRQFVSLKVYNVLGKEIAVLVDGYKAAGSYSVEFNASELPSGIYFYRLEVGAFVETRKMILMK